MTPADATPKVSKKAGWCVLLLFTFCSSPFTWLTAAQVQPPSPDLAAVPRAERVKLLRAKAWDVKAVRAQASIEVDGALDEPDWDRAEPVTDFYQGQRNEGLLSTERTAVRVLYDDKNVYVGFRAWDDEPEKLNIRSIFRDESGGADDLVSIMLDAYHGQRTAIQFVSNANGLMEDLLQTGETTNTRNHDWDAVWYSRGRRLPDGFEVEVAIPFKSLRFEPPAGSGEITFGIGFKRNIPRKNEEVTWPFVPNDSTWYRPAELGTLHGLTNIKPGHNVEMRPFVLAGRLENYVAGSLDKTRKEVGVDAKWGVTTGITADFTVNTDFAQEEADVQQVNLTRFSVFFPEKRQFFLEGQQAFRFGVPRQADLIFTRRIGLSSAGEPVRIFGGARLSGRQGRTTVGAMSLQVDDNRGVPSQNFTVLRVKQDVLARSSVGAMFSNVQGGGAFNRVVGADASFYVKRAWFFDAWGAHVSQTGGGDGSNGGYGHAAYEKDRYGAGYSFLGIGESFNPGVGFVLRPNSLQHDSYARFSPRPRDSIVRQLHFTGRLGYITDTAAVIDTRERELEARADFESGDAVNVVVTNQLENLKESFRLRSDITLPPGTYAWNEVSAKWDAYRRRHLQLDATYTTGGFYTGNRHAAALTFNWRVATPFGFSTNYSVNWVDLPEGSFTTKLLSSRVQVALRNDLAILTLFQYNQDTRQFSTNLRFNWIPKPGSDFFLVYNETDNTLGAWAPRNRTLTVKLNYLVAM